MNNNVNLTYSHKYILVNFIELNFSNVKQNLKMPSYYLAANLSAERGTFCEYSCHNALYLNRCRNYNERSENYCIRGKYVIC